ncbi:DoxX family protein [Virgibacillus sp. W0181]|uniref:DoxX family protein n=1 Tax=Virgibacillus sp. W0181 TaxID=3391581 RepID=UPI003F45A4A9
MRVHTLKWIGYAIGYVFITSGIMKLIASDFKGIFTSLGIPFPEATLFLIAIVEITCGTLIVAGMYVKQATLPLIIVMLGAIFITKIPIIASKGVFSFAFEARLDVVMLILLLILWQKSAPTKIS